MIYRPFVNAESFAIRRKMYPRSPLFSSHRAMNISQPLSRASCNAELTLQRLFSEKHSSRRYLRMPKIPRIPKMGFPTMSPLKRSPFNHSTVPRNWGLSRRQFSSAPQKIKNKTKNIHRRFFSTEARKQRRERRRFVRWWTLMSLTIVLGGVAAKIRYEKSLNEDDEEDPSDPFSQSTIKPQSWLMYAYSTLPLKTMSRLWGQFNSIDLPVWLRGPSYKLYLAMFGVNLDEMDEPDLKTYSNLSEFFYRRLKPGVRPIADSDVVSPSDGKVLKFGIIENGEIEQVKGMTYSIDALLGMSKKHLAAPTHSLEFDAKGDSDAVVKRDEEFARINGITYSVDDLVGGEGEETFHNRDLSYHDKGDGTASDSQPSLGKDISVAQKLMPSVPERMNQSGEKNLYFAVIYLAPGDYHRYHSPTNWVATLRRHFIGELFSVAPFFQKTLPGLFVLNERVALLGYWKYGFFSMTPVGATNVGSIVVNFDKYLKTNDVYEHEVYLRSSRESSPSETTALLEEGKLLYSEEGDSVSDSETKPKKMKKNTVYEATYTNGSKLLGGYPLGKGEEVGGFKLGSTVVLVFEAPANFKFDLEVGQRIKMGESLGGFK